MEVTLRSFVFDQWDNAVVEKEKWESNRIYGEIFEVKKESTQQQKKKTHEFSKSVTCKV